MPPNCNPCALETKPQKWGFLLSIHPKAHQGYKVDLGIWECTAFWTMSISIFGIKMIFYLPKDMDEASFIRIKLQWGGSGWVGVKLWTAPPRYNSKGFLGWAPATPFFFGQRSLVWLSAGALFYCVVVQVAIFHMADFSLKTC